MQLEAEKAETSRTQKTYARLAGILLLGALVLAFGGGSILSSIAGDGTFAETATRIAEIGTLVSSGARECTPCVFERHPPCLRTLCNAQAHRQAHCSARDDLQFGRLITVPDRAMCGFVRLHLYLSARANGAESRTGEPLSDLIRTVAGTTENIGGISFGIGSCLFFYLFFKSRYIPRAISVLGFVACLVWTGLYFSSLIFPERHVLFQYIYFPPMAVAEIVTGFYLMLFAVGRGRNTTAAAASSAADA